jgi:ribosomal protein L34E
MGDEIEDKGDGTELARALAARRRVEKKECLVCGQPFTGIAKKRYCSGRCATRAHRMGLSKPYSGRSKDDTKENEDE